MIVFESIRWKNFLSTGDQWTEIRLDESDSTLIIGTNGAGKSTVLDALTFVLFNKPFRKINKPQLVNSVNEKGLKVEVCFSIGKDEYRVWRGIKPNTFEIYKNNKLVDQDAATKDTQKYLEQSILKLNYKSFTQVVILGSSTFVPFMQLPAAHRREVIEDLLDIGIFSSMNTVLKDKVKAATTQSKECAHLVRLADERVSSQEKLISSLEEVNSTRQKEKQDKILQNQEKIAEIAVQKKESQTDLEKYQDSLVNVDSQKELLAGLRRQQAEINTEMKGITKEIKFFKAHDQCPTCDQTIGEDFKKKKISILKDDGISMSTKFNSLTNEIADAVSIVEEMDTFSMKCHELRSRISGHDREVVRLEFENLEISKELVDLQTKTPNINKENESLIDLKKQLSDTMEDCSRINQTLDEYQVVSSLLRDSGVKSQIIKKYVPVFNQLINKYLQSMDFYVNFTLDEEFNEVIKSRFRDEFSYASFSEGEKQKIDLALLFTWREVARMKNSVATNLLILDEVFDSSLDDQATGELLKILRSLGRGTNTLVISHKGDILVDKFSRTLKFEKINDFSRMSDDS